MSLRLVLFFTRGMSLHAWEQLGIFDREVALYRRLQESGIQVTFVTYGGGGDLAFDSRLPGVRVLCNRWGLTQSLYRRGLPWLHGGWLRCADVIKTNQTDGAEVALDAARLWRKPLIARCGYMWSDLASSNGATGSAALDRARRTEMLVFSGAQRVAVTTPSMRDYAVQQYGLPPVKVRVIPNYVLTDLFSPDGSERPAGRICFVGGLAKHKNPLALVEACAGLDVELVVVGDGPLRAAVAETAARLRVRITLTGNLPHAQLPGVLRQSTLFALVSPHEGHPKALLEAMASGLPVVGADSPGIRELIHHGETGWLCGTAPGSIRAAILELLGRPTLCSELGRNARQYVVDNFSLDRVVKSELALLHEVVGS